MQQFLFKDHRKGRRCAYAGNAMIELDVNIQAGDLYDYMLAHTYNGSSGILGTTFGALLIIMALAGQRWILLLPGIVILLYLPWTLFIKSRKQALMNPSFRHPLHYVLDEEGITVSQGDTSQKQVWSELYKATSTGRSIIVYTSKVNATIFPKREMGGQKTEVIRMISTHMPPDKVKIRS